MWVCNLRGDFKVPGHRFQAKSWAMWALQKGRSCCSYMGGCCMRVTEQYKLVLFKCWKGVRLVVPQPFKCCLASESSKPFMLWLVERYRARKCFKCWLLHSATKTSCSWQGKVNELVLPGCFKCLIGWLWLPIIIWKGEKENEKRKEFKKGTLQFSHQADYKWIVNVS